MTDVTEEKAEEELEELEEPERVLENSIQAHTVGFVEGAGTTCGACGKFGPFESSWSMTGAPVKGVCYGSWKPTWRGVKSCDHYIPNSQRTEWMKQKAEEHRKREERRGDD